MYRLRKVNKVNTRNTGGALLRPPWSDLACGYISPGPISQLVVVATTFMVIKHVVKITMTSAYHQTMALDSQKYFTLAAVNRKYHVGLLHHCYFRDFQIMSLLL